MGQWKKMLTLGGALKKVRKNGWLVDNFPQVNCHSKYKDVTNGNGVVEWLNSLNGFDYFSNV